uniref:Uncharacterized protein n=1 Tax=Naja naja TaxID=35670 RepID=A0A8C6Y5T8_NAJNA
MRYGAWYLDPKTWKKQNVNEPLENPKESSLKNSRRLLSEELIQVHGTHAFQEFLVKKGYRIPEVNVQCLPLTQRWYLAGSDQFWRTTSGNFE